MNMTTTPPLDQQNMEEDSEMLVPHSEEAVVEGPQPMEVVQPENTSAENTTTVDAMAVEDPPSGRFTWAIDNFSRLQKKHYSDVFTVGGYKWRILIFPKGNNAEHLSMYIDVADSSSMPFGWTRFAQFSLSVVNQVHSKYTIRKETQHQFNARESDWGFTNFMPLSELYDPGRGYIVDDRCILEADVNVRKDLDYWAHDSKKETGCVGLKNQGATCYMNSLLQTLYHIPYFRKAVYHMPTTENDMPSGSIPLALQSLFYKLQYNDSSVSTKELTKSFGWDTYDSFMQHDVQELNRVLCEKLEDKMKGTVVEGTIQQLFEGHHMNYIECINVDYKSTRKESFYDLQLDVKGCTDVYASFDKYVEVEKLEGDNKYHAEQYGLQEAKKGVLFIDFPPVLQLQLKRFEYDFVRDTMVKINDRYEFPLQLDLDRDNGKYLSPDADRSIRNLYTLHSVLVHSGGVHGGHYYAYIRPTLSNQWFKFDDERVTKEDTNRALEEQYGGEEELPHTNPGFNNSPFKFTKYSNAYMLVYVRESDKDKIICNVDEKDIAKHLRIRLKKEQEEKEKKKKEKAEAHLYTIVKIARDDDLHEQIGKDMFFDLVDHDKVRSFRVQKQTPFVIFKEEVAKEFGIPVEHQRFWLWAKRQNHTYRPSRPVTFQEETQSVGQLREASNKANNAELKLFLEIEKGQDLRPIPPPEKLKEELLLFFKLYEPSTEKLRYVGRLFVMGSRKPADILTKLNEMAGFAPDQEIDLFEEIKFDPKIMCELVDKKCTFRDNQLEDGDIICFQKNLQAGEEQQYCYPDVYSFFDYVQNRQVVRFRFLEKRSDFNFYSFGSKPEPEPEPGMDGVPDRGRSTSPSSRTPNHTPRLGPSRLSSSRVRSSQSSASSSSSSSCLWLWCRRKRTKVLLALIALFALFFFVNYIMLLHLQHQQDRPHRNPKPTLRSSLSISLQGKSNKNSTSKKTQKGNYVRMLALAAHALAENKREPKDLWQEPLVPASSWTPCSDQRNWEPNEGSNGYILVTANGGINQQRVAVCNAVVVARLLNSTLVVPKFMYSSVWRDSSQFRDIYQEEHFINYLAPDIRIVRDLPKKLQSLDLEAISSVITDVDMGKEARPTFYLKHVLPIILKNQVVHFIGFGNRLAFDPIPFELQRLRCRCNFHALQFVPRIQETGALLLKRLRGHAGLIGPLDRHFVGPFGELKMETSEKNSKKASKYLALHLRFEIDMVAHSLCEFGGGEEERKELEAYREIHFPALALMIKTTKLPSPSELRSEGLCPLTPEESILMLAALGFNRKTNLFVAGSNLYGGGSRLAALTSLYPKLVTKENLLSSAELEPFANYSSQLAALDFIGCAASDAFAMTDSGSQLSSLVSGYRIYYGGGRMPTIRPNKRRLASIFMKNSSIEWRIFEQRMRKAVRQTKHVQTRPKARSVYRYPRCKECMCRTI